MRRLVLIAAAALIAATAAGAAGRAEPGLSATTILIGGTVPLSGEAAAFGTVGPGAKAYFDYVNSKGGVNGRKIEYRYYDDAYNPAQTVQLTRQLVEQDQGVRDLQRDRHREQPRDPRLPERPEGAAPLRRRRVAGARRRLGPLPLDGRLPPELPGRGLGARARRRPDGAPRADRRPLREHRARQGHDPRPLARPRRQEPAHRRLRGLRADLDGRRLADLVAEGLGSGHAHAVRDAEVPHPGDRRGEEARLEAAPLPRVRLDRAVDHGDRAGQRARPDARGAGDRLRQEPERPGVGARTPRWRCTARS